MRSLYGYSSDLLLPGKEKTDIVSRLLLLPVIAVAPDSLFVSIDNRLYVSFVSAGGNGPNTEITADVPAALQFENKKEDKSDQQNRNEPEDPVASLLISSYFSTVFHNPSVFSSIFFIQLLP